MLRFCRILISLSSDSIFFIACAFFPHAALSHSSFVCLFVFLSLSGTLRFLSTVSVCFSFRCDFCREGPELFNLGTCITLKRFFAFADFECVRKETFSPAACKGIHQCSMHDQTCRLNR
jgi:hypothetical protein